MDPLSIFFTVMGGLASGISSIVNWKQKHDVQDYTKEMNQRDFDYQQALQQQIFQREDTAVQRRMVDLQNAGLNPNLAAGSSAGAGAVVGRSNTDSYQANSLGSAMDFVSAISQIGLQRQEAKNKKIEQSILQEQKAKLDFDNGIDNYLKLSALGFGLTPGLYKGQDDRLHIDYDVDDWSSMVYHLKSGNTYYPNARNKGNLMLDNMNNQAQLLNIQKVLAEKDLNWYTADKIINYGLDAANFGLDVFGTYNSLRKGSAYTNYMNRR